MVQVPEYDLSSVLEGDPRWDVELYTERTVDVLLDSPDRFDCIVVGYNAAYKSAAIRDGLRARPPGVGLCVLHQLRAEGLSFLSGDVGVRFEVLGGPTAPVSVAANLDPTAEILLNWPGAVGLDGSELSASAAYAGVIPVSRSRWRTLLEVRGARRRVPVLLRTHTGRWPPVVLSAALLAPRHPAHAALLGNMVLWCAAGRPTAVVVDTPSSPDAPVVHRKLRLQGTRAIAHRVADESELDFDRWPLRGTRDVMLPPGWDPTAKPGWPQEDPRNAKPWLRDGGRIVLLGPGDSLTIRHGESDAHWVAQRWAAWFDSTPPATWHGGQAGGRHHPGSIVATRSVLRMLAALHDRGGAARLPGMHGARRVLDALEEREAGVRPMALGLPPPAAMAGPVGRLLVRRIGDADNVDGTVSATVAALDIDALLDRGVLPDGTRERLEAWLRRRSHLDRAEAAALEDRLEIARCLGDAGLLRTTLAGADADARLRAPLSAVLVTALRSAIVACELDPDEGAIGGLRTDRDSVVETELRTRPMLAANYLLAVLDLEARWPAECEGPARELVEPPARIVDRAVITIGRHGVVVRGVADDAGPSPEMASTEALALIAYFGRSDVPTHVVRGADTVPPQMLSSVLREAEELRRENEERLRDERIVRLVGPVLAVAGELLLLALIAVAWWLVATATDLAVTWELGAFFLVWVLGTLLILWLLGRARLPVSWAPRAAELLRGGVAGVREQLAAAVTRAPRGRDE
jgi:hypothetical protein